MSAMTITLPMCSVDFMDTTLSVEDKRSPTEFKN